MVSNRTVEDVEGSLTNIMGLSGMSLLVTDEHSRLEIHDQGDL